MLSLSVDRVRLPDGSSGDVEMIHHSGAAAILPVLGPLQEPDPEILLIKQYRYAAGGELYEVPAGGRDGEESWEACALRELEEETGMRAARLIPMTRVYTTPGFSDEVIHMYMAVELSQGTPHLGDDEFVELVRLKLSEALEWVRTGRIHDAKTVATLLFAERFVLPHASAGLSNAPTRRVPQKGREPDEMA